MDKVCGQNSKSRKRRIKLVMLNPVKQIKVEFESEIVTDDPGESTTSYLLQYNSFQTVGALIAFFNTKTVITVTGKEG